MCLLCRTYGRRVIKGQQLLKDAIETAGELLTDGNYDPHIMSLIDIWIDGDAEPDKDVEALWAMTKSGRP
jgi:hypothetical protein